MVERHGRVPDGRRARDHPARRPARSRPRCRVSRRTRACLRSSSFSPSAASASIACSRSSASSACELVVLAAGVEGLVEPVDQVADRLQRPARALLDRAKTGRDAALDRVQRAALGLGEAEPRAGSARRRSRANEDRPAPADLLAIHRSSGLSPRERSAGRSCAAPCASPRTPRASGRSRRRRRSAATRRSARASGTPRAAARSKPCSSAPPPASVMPRSMMSPASSGGVRSSVSLTAPRIWPSGSSSAPRTSSERQHDRLRQAGDHVAAADLGRDLLRQRRRRAELELHLLGGLLADQQLVGVLAVVDDRVVHLVAADPDRLRDDDPAERDHGDLAGAAADVDDHRAHRLRRPAGRRRSRPPSAPRSGRPGGRRRTGRPPRPRASRPR